ncbi:MAG: hypothetical protein ACYDH0_04255 [Candidatus Aminicenantales bacterium]
MKNNKIFILLFCFFLGLLQINIQLYGAQPALAGEAEFPKEYYAKWLAAQRDPSLNEEAKVKSTIDTYFILKYESWKTGKLLDFGFLFELGNTKAFEDYAYERGVLLVYLAGQSYWGGLLARYDYLPTYRKLKIVDRDSEVLICPTAEIVHADTNGAVDTTPWTDHQITLEKIGGHWLIRSLSTDDEMHDSLPRGIDFNEKARLLPIKEKAWDEAPFMPLLRILEEPRFEALNKRLFGANTDRNAANTTMEEIRDRFYGEIAGDYLLDSGKGRADIIFTPGEKYPKILVPILEDAFLPLIPNPRPDGEDPTVFGIRVEDRRYMLRFLWDESGRITKFEMTDIAGLERYIAIKGLGGIG